MSFPRSKSASSNPDEEAVLEELKEETADYIDMHNQLVSKFWVAQQKLHDIQSSQSFSPQHLNQTKKEIALLEIEIDEEKSLEKIETNKERIKALEKKLHHIDVDFEQPYLYSKRPK